MLEELARRAVEHRAARRGLPADHPDEAPLEEVRQHALGPDAAELLDLRPRDRLAVGDDRERLHRRPRQPALQPEPLQAHEQRRVLGPRDQAHPPPTSATARPRPRLLARRAESASTAARALERVDLENLGDPLERQRRVGGEEERLQLAQPLRASPLPGSPDPFPLAQASRSAPLPEAPLDDDLPNSSCCCARARWSRTSSRTARSVTTPRAGAATSRAASRTGRTRTARAPPRSSPCARGSGGASGSTSRVGSAWASRPQEGAIGLA